MGSWNAEGPFFESAEPLSANPKCQSQLNRVPPHPSLRAHTAMDTPTSTSTSTQTAPPLPVSSSMDPTEDNPVGGAAPIKSPKHGAASHTVPRAKPA